jgi:hypothetical protein
MTRFWLATFAVDIATESSAVGPILNAGSPNLAMEVLRDKDEWAVLFSSVDNLSKPTWLTCLIGFTNMAKPCNVWLDRGFPLVDAIFTHNKNGLSVVSPLFQSGQVMHYETELFALSGINFDAPLPARSSTDKKETLKPTYRQHLQTPDGAQPDVLVAREPVTWAPTRRNVRELSKREAAQMRLDFGTSPSRCPSLAPLETGVIKPTAVWTGEIAVPKTAEDPSGRLLKPSKVAHAFGVPAFRFEDVEVIGFRLNLSELGSDVQRNLAELIEPLNFHLAEDTGEGSDRWRGARPDFRFRAATHTLVIELLRYGRMKARVPSPPLGRDDSQSQHELVVRLLVGRVDDDSSQAREPAVYVPAIFVDNPWSKVLGRDAIGFDKRMVDFFVRRDGQHERLLPDGRLPRLRTPRKPLDEWKPEPLGDIRQVKLVERTGAGNGRPLLDLEYFSNDHTDPSAFQPIDLDLAFGSSVLAGTRWRQSDFDEGEFRRSFASLSIADSVRRFRSIQVAPVSTRGALRQAWITGTFEVDADVRAALPTGIATLTLHAAEPDTNNPSRPSAPGSWNLLCQMLGNGKQAKVTVTTGGWYRLLCSMDLTIDDGLNWNTPSA